MKHVFVILFIFCLINSSFSKNLSLNVNYVYDSPKTIQLEIDENGQIVYESIPQNVAIVDMNRDNRFDAFVFNGNKLELHFGLIMGFSKTVSATWEFDQSIKNIRGYFDRDFYRGKLDIEFVNGETDFIMQWQNKMLLKSEYDAHPEIYQVKREIPSTLKVDNNFQIIWEAPNLGFELADVNMLIGDIDQDGKKELIFQSYPIQWGSLRILYIYENITDNNFQMIYSYEDTVYGYSVKEITDLDADGNLELTALPGGGPIGWTLNPYFILFESTGDNSFNRFMIPAFVNIQEISPRDMHWADSNLNGKPELVIGFNKDIGSVSSYVHFYENINPNTFDRRHWWLQVYQLYLHGIAVGDLDNDGWGDVYVGMAGSSTYLRRWEYNGYQSFDQKWFNTGLCSPMYPEIFDFDDDGLLELTSLTDWWDYYPGRGAILYLEAIGDDSLQVIALDTTSYTHGSWPLWGRNWNKINNEYYITAPAEIWNPGPPSYFDGYSILLKRNPNYAFPFEPIFYSPVIDSYAIHHALAADLDNDNKVELITGRTNLPARVRIWEDNTVQIVKEENNKINGFYLHAYPNPFNNSTMISFSLSKAAKIDVEVYNLLGQKVQQPVRQKFFSAGNHRVLLDKMQSSGLYLLRLKSADFSKTIKLMLIK